MVINKLTLLANHLENSYGKITLFVAFHANFDLTKWNIMISAQWLNERSEKDGLNLLSEKMKLYLDTNELLSFTRISIINTNNPLVMDFNERYEITNYPKFFPSVAIVDGFEINDVFIIRSQSTNYFPVGNESRNPKYNSSINPRYNSSINPRYNSSINPRYNSSINPRYNSSINPRYNSSINPRYNSSINPRYNSSINPRYNSSINPRYNSSINPRTNINFDGYFIFDLSLEKQGYIINANENVIILFDMDNNQIGYGILNSTEGYTIFDTNNEWIGYYVKIENGFLNYNLDNNWIGLIF